MASAQAQRKVGNQDDGLHGAEQEAVRATGRGKSKASARKVTYGFHLVEGRMPHGMEDRHVAEFRRLDDGNEVGLFGVFDGHSGADVATYLRNHLFDNILGEPDFWEDPMKAIRRAYHRTDRKVLKKKKVTVDGQDRPRRGGSTAVTVILLNGENLVVANVGTPARRDVPRVDASLAMSRAFGDRRLKEHISSDPDVTIEDISDDTELVVVASDGLWKVMSNQEAVDEVRDTRDARKAAVKLVDSAVDRGSKDDIACVVVRIH
ncbi:hypothetical protein ZWY2020_034453 [Hordeum vulgare]|nr:hypothetical protein ZWY2020_034453 [Hordeum vulgare]